MRKTKRIAKCCRAILKQLNIRPYVYLSANKKKEAETLMLRESAAHDIQFNHIRTILEGK